MSDKIKCPKCSKSDFSVQNQGGSTTTFLHCKSCGYKGTKEAWTKQQKDLSASKNPFYKKANEKENDHPYNKMYPETGPWNSCKCGQDYQVGINGDSRLCEACLMQESMKNRIKSKKSPLAKGTVYYKVSQSTSVGDDKKPASDQPNTENDPKAPTQRGFSKKPRKKPERAFGKEDPEEVRRVSMNNPFYKKSQEEVLNDSANKDYIAVFSVYEKGPGDTKTKRVEIPFQAADWTRAKIKARDLIYEEENKNKYDSMRLVQILSLEDNSNSISTNEFSFFSKNNPFYKNSKKDNMKGEKGPESCVSKKEEKNMEGSKGPKGDKGKSGPTKATTNPFYKKSDEQPTECPHCGHHCKGEKCLKCGKEKENLENAIGNKFDEIFSKSNPFYKSSKNIKIAREFSDRSEHGKKMKELSDKNMIYNENPLYSTRNQGNNNNGDDTKREKNEFSDSTMPDEQDHLNPSFNYNTVDRKEYRSSPNPNDFIPGYKDWYDREVDKYYDGWLDDHIENAGGSIPGSNTEKVMNLNDGERAHAPVFPTEAIYEKLLEGRHNFDGDYTRIVANGKTFVLKKADVEEILKTANPKKKKQNEKEINVRSPYSPDVKDGEERRLYNGSDENALFFDPETGKIYHKNGNAFKEKQPVWKTKKEVVKE